MTNTRIEKVKNEVTIQKMKMIKKQELDDFQKVLSTPEGRRFFIRLLDECGYNSTSFTGNSTTFFNEGKRQIALVLLNDINTLNTVGLELKHQAEKEYIMNQIEIDSSAKQIVKNLMNNN